MLDNQTLQDKYPHLEVSVSPLSKVKKHFILGSDFNSNIREETLSNIKSEYKVSDYFDLINATISQIQEPYYIYDLTHSLGNFLQDVELTQNKLGSNKKQVKKDDLIISRLRSYLQEIAVVQQKKFKQLVSTEYLVYRPKTELISSNTLMVFALTKSVQTILSYSQYGTEHPRFYEFVFDEMPIPKVILELNHHIDSMIKEAYKAIESSKALYKEAEALLYEALGLDSKNPLQSILNTHYKSLPYHYKKNENSVDATSNQIPNTTIATLKESFIKTGRLDTEYYQAKYEKNEALLKNYKYGFCKLKDLIQRQSSGFAFSSDEYVDCSDLVLIRINNIKNATLDMSNAVYLKNEAQNLSPKDKVYKGDILISMSGSIGMSCVVRDDVNAMLNQRIYKIAVRGFSPDVLVVFLNSVCAKLQFERIGTGGVQTNISGNDIQSLLIPLLDSTSQERIENKIRQSFELRAKSKKLLRIAKQRVEEAIVSKKKLRFACFARLLVRK